jgi:uncharacterized phage protein (TIGR02220 family)
MNFYAVIPAVILVNEDLSSNEKILYGIISSLTNKLGYCYATNKTLGDYFKKDDTIPHPKTISKWVNNLVSLGYLTNELYTEKSKQERRIRLADKIVIKQEVKKKITEDKPKKEEANYDGMVSRIIAYLNKITGKNFSEKTSKYVKLIVGQIEKNGRTMDDFMKVVEAASVNDWYINNPQFFAPTTLFRAEKFEAHLAAWTLQTREAIYATSGDKPKTEINLSEKDY